MAHSLATKKYTRPYMYIRPCDVRQQGIVSKTLYIFTMHCIYVYKELNAEIDNNTRHCPFCYKDSYMLVLKGTTQSDALKDLQGSKVVYHTRSCSDR